MTLVDLKERHQVSHSPHSTGNGEKNSHFQLQNDFQLKGILITEADRKFPPRHSEFPTE